MCAGEGVPVFVYKYVREWGGDGLYCVGGSVVGGY